MKKVNTSTKNMGQFAGKWVAIDTKSNRIIAAGTTLQEISPFVTGKTNDKHKIAAAAFKVPRKDEGPYVLIVPE
ncbi:MAG: DUF5678 domain-containing protein [bacterium]|nr:DUF5678 domain-containing protein [bacterium]